MPPPTTLDGFGPARAAYPAVGQVLAAWLAAPGPPARFEADLEAGARSLFPGLVPTLRALYLDLAHDVLREETRLHLPQLARALPENLEHAVRSACFRTLCRAWDPRTTCDDAAFAFEQAAACVDGARAFGGDVPSSKTQTTTLTDALAEGLDALIFEGRPAAARIHAELLGRFNLMAYVPEAWPLDPRVWQPEPGHSPAWIFYEAGLYGPGLSRQAALDAFRDGARGMRLLGEEAGDCAHDPCSA